MLYDKDEVKKFLPHREPFLFVDSVEEIVIPNRELGEGEILPLKESIGGWVKAFYHVRNDHPIFAGHFPDFPILPGVIQVEMMAQASAFILTKCYERPFEMKLDVQLISIEKTKFRKPIFPDMDLVLKCTANKVRGIFMGHRGELFHSGELMSECEFLSTVKLTEKK